MKFKSLNNVVGEANLEKTLEECARDEMKAWADLSTAFALFAGAISRGDKMGEEQAAKHLGEAITMAREASNIHGMVVLLNELDRFEEKAKNEINGNN